VSKIIPLKALSMAVTLTMLTACGNRHYIKEEVYRNDKTETKKGYRSLQQIEFYKGKTEGARVELYAKDIYSRPYEEYAYQHVKYQSKTIREPNIFMIVVGLGIGCIVALDMCFGKYGKWYPYYNDENRKKIKTYSKTESEPSRKSQRFQLIINNRKTINTESISPKKGVFHLNLQDTLEKTAQRPQSVMIKPLHKKSDDAFIYQVDSKALQTFTTAAWVQTSQKALHQGKLPWNDFMHEVNLLSSYQEKVHYALDSHLFLGDLSAATDLALKVKPPYTNNSHDSISKVYLRLMKKQQYADASLIAGNLWEDTKDAQSKQLLFDVLLAMKAFDKAQALLSENDRTLQRQLAILRDAPLPKSIRKDKYLKLLARELGEEDWEEALYYCQQLRKLAIQLPDPVDYFQGETLYHLGNKQDAQTYLLHYANLGSAARYYNKSIDLLNKISGM